MVHTLCTLLYRQVTVDIERTLKNNEVKKGSITYIERMVNWASFLYFCLQIEPDASPQELMSLLSFEKEQSEDDEELHYVLVGLHTCGNLATTMLRLFAESKVLVGLVSVGCCYMKLSETENPQLLSSSGYPMSSGLADHRLSYEAKELACHSKEVYMKRLQGQYFK